jgi:probable phosphoglycerate mutase
VNEIAHGGRVWLVRHAESTWNSLGVVQGQDDTATLTTHGRHQSARLATRLSRYPVVAVYASDLRRARETAAPVAAVFGLPVVTDEDLRERSFGDFEGGPVDALHPGVTGLSDHRVVDGGARPDGGESLHDVQQRVGRFVDRLDSERRTGDVVVVAHGGSVRAFRNYCAGQCVEDMAWDAVANASVWPILLQGPVCTAAPGEIRTEH